MNISETQVAIQVTNGELNPSVELFVHENTKLRDLVPVLEFISDEINPRISPKGCEVCTSGNDFRITELIEPLRVDLTNSIRFDLKSSEFTGDLDALGQFSAGL